MKDNGEFLRKSKQLELLKAKKKLESELPHLYGQKFYHWSRQWWESTNTINLMNKGNQVGGSSIQIRKAIHWATDPALRMKLFGKTPEEPLQFLFFMPALNLFCREFQTKWIPQFMPRGDSKLVGQYAWQAEYDVKSLEWINFINFTGANTMMFTLGYGSDPHKSMQAMSPDAIFADEEMPQHVWGEIFARLSAKFGQKRGYFHMDCTPTRGEQIWDEAFNENRFPGALIMNVSQYDCLKFEDGTPGVHTVDGINQFKQGLGNERDIQIRVYGKYAKSEGLVFESFDAARNFTPRHNMGTRSQFYSGIDYGSGGPTGHPAAISIIEVSADNKRAQLHKFWKGNKVDKTDPAAILNVYLEMREGLTMNAEYYDWGSPDLETVGKSMGLSLLKANKDRKHGLGLMNSLFKNDMLNIPKEEEFEPIVKELMSLRTADLEGVKKKHAKDDGSDSFRYALSSVFFDFADVKYNPDFKPTEAPEKKEKTFSREPWREVDLNEDIENEINEFNELLDY